jgi:hypothetical protein
MMFCRSSICCAAALVGGLFFAAPVALAQTNYYITNGIEYSIVGALPGDQVYPDVAISPTGGYVVWQDNTVDGSGWGIGARQLDATLSGTLSTFRVNQTLTNDQQNPRVAMIKGGGAVYVWQGGPASQQHIYAAFQSASGTFVNTTDVIVNASMTNFQVFPAVAVLNNSNVVVVYASLNQAGSYSQQDVYGQLFSPLGQKIGGEFLVNQFTPYNQRSASVAALNNGNFIVTWISEQEQAAAPSYSTPSAFMGSTALGRPSADVYARIFAPTAAPIGNEFLVDTNNKPCACPSVSAAADGSYMIVWAAHDDVNYTNGWDIYARAFTSNCVGGNIAGVNTYVYGDQLFPRISALNNDFMITWTSYGQDGSREGVYAQELHDDGSFVGGEFQVNTTVIGPQFQQAVASDGFSQFLFVWSTFGGIDTRFDLAAQRYINISGALPAMGAPYVNEPFTFSNGVYEAQLAVSWPYLLGLSISSFEVYVDGSGTPTGVVSSNQWTYLTVPSSTHAFRVDYITTGGLRSPISAAASGTTWSGNSWGGIPIEWMAHYFGSDSTKWPAATADSDNDGVSNLQEFLAGTNPTNSASVLRQELITTQEGLFLSWNTQPGLTYQVQATTNLTGWVSFGRARFAAGTNDSVYVGSNPGYYRIVLQR